MSELAPEMRVGDRERRDVDALLQEALADGVLTLTEYDERAAQCWGARTRTELDRVVHDLPSARPPAPPATTARGTRRVVAVMSESELAVPLAAGEPVQAIAVMGTAKVDLRREDLPPEVRVQAIAVMGEVKVHVPPGTTVHLTGGALMGERKARVGPPVAGGSVVHVNAAALMGTVVVDDRPRKGGLLPPSVAAPLQRSAHALVHSRRPADVEPARQRRHGRGPLRRLLPVALAAVVAVSAVQVVTADDGAAVFGSRTVNATDQTTVDIGVLFGSVEVVVHDNARVRTKGAMVFGSVDCEQACEGGTGPEVVINGNGAFGSIEVVREGERDREEP